MERVDVLVVGGGSAGLSVSHELASLGIDHVVLERGRIGQAWRDRWDSFCLVTPNWSVRLPGGTYAGDDPDGFMPRDEIVAHLERYAADVGSPVREGVSVRTIDGPGRVRRPDVRRRHATPRASSCAPARSSVPPPRRLRLAPGRPPADRHRGVPQRGQPAAGPGPHRRQRPVGLPARRGAPRGRPRRRPRVREGAVGAAPAGRPRPRLVARGVGLPRPAGREPAVSRPPASARTRSPRATAAATT